MVMAGSFSIMANTDWPSWAKSYASNGVKRDISALSGPAAKMCGRPARTHLPPSSNAISLSVTVKRGIGERGNLMLRHRSAEAEECAEEVDDGENGDAVDEERRAGRLDHHLADEQCEQRQRERQAARPGGGAGPDGR